VAAAGGARLVAVCLGLAACAEAAPPAASDRAAQEVACDLATAAHIGLPPDAVATAWHETGPAGIAVFQALDGERLHLCTVDAAGRVLRLEHPPGGAD